MSSPRSSVAVLALLATAASARAETPAPERSAGHDFKRELALLHRVVAGAEPGVAVPPAWVEVVDEHCASLGKQTERFRARYVDEAIPFIAALRPPDLPGKVVY